MAERVQAAKKVQPLEETWGPWSQQAWQPQNWHENQPASTTPKVASVGPPVGAPDRGGRAAVAWSQPPRQRAMSPPRELPQSSLPQPDVQLPFDRRPQHPAPDAVDYSSVLIQGFIECEHRVCLPYDNQHGSGWKCEECLTKWFRRNNGQDTITNGSSRYRRPGWKGFRPGTRPKK